MAQSMSPLTASTLERYTTEFLPWLESQRRWPRISLAMLFASFAATVACGWWITLTESESESGSWWAVGVLLPVTLLFGTIAWEALSTLRRSFREQVLDALLREAWPEAQVDVHGRIGGDTLQRAGFFLFMQRREFHGLVRLSCAGVPVAVCAGEVYRVDQEDVNTHDERIFRGTVFEIGMSLSLAGPVVITTPAVRERPVPAGSAAFGKQSLGVADFDSTLRVWADSAAAARAAIPSALALRLVEIVRGLPDDSALRLVLDEDGVHGALDGKTGSALVYPFGALPTGEDLANEVARVATVSEIAKACAETLRYQTRELADFEGQFRPAARAAGVAARASPQEAVAALSQLEAAGIRVSDHGSYAMVDFTLRRSGPGVVAAFVLSSACVAVMLDRLQGDARLGGVAAVIGELPGADTALAWLVSLHPWSTLLIAATPLPLFWQWLLSDPRSLRVSGAGLQVVRGVCGRSVQIDVGHDSLLRVANGRIYLQNRVVSPLLGADTAVALARLMAPRLGCNLDSALT